jgi:prevent-host-death family protein
MRRKHVGSRELKARLGTYLRLVRQGDSLIVTDRGQAVAELRPIASATGSKAVLERLAATGAVTLPVKTALAAFRPVENHGRSAAAAVIEDREDRF